MDAGEHLRLAAETALEILEFGGNGEGWTAADAICALRLGLHLEVGSADSKRMEGIEPTLVKPVGMVLTPTMPTALYVRSADDFHGVG